MNWTNVTDAQANVATILGQTNNIASIQTKTNTINWADVTGLVTTAGTIVGKTSTINWADVTGIKTATDTINWANVTGIKAKTDLMNWANVTDAQANVATILGQTNNIASIQTKTDTINWADVTGVVTTSGQIKAATDTINWSQVAAIKTATDTINWANVTGIKAKTDLMNWTNVTDVKTDVATILGQTNNIGSIKTATDTINWADVTGLITTSGQIKGKTDTINWSEVSAVKTRTDTINWSDVTGIKAKTDVMNWTNVTDMKAQTDNITDIKAQTDKIPTDVLVDLGLIKGYTDGTETAISTLDGKVVAVKAVADATLSTLADINPQGIASLSGKVDALQTDTTSALTDLGIIKGYTDETKSQITTLDGKVVDVKTVADAIKLETDKIQAIKSQTDSIASILTNVNTVNDKTEEVVGLVNKVLDKWDTVTARDIMKSFDKLMTGDIGSPMGPNTADTLFGKLSILISKLDTVTSSTVSSAQSSATGASVAAATPVATLSTETPLAPPKMVAANPPAEFTPEPGLAISNTIAKSTLQDAQSAYNEIQSAREMLQASGKNDTAKGSMMQVQNALIGISGTLNKIEAALTNPLYGRVLNIAEQVKSTGIVTGGETVKKLYDIPADKANDVGYLQGKLYELKEAAELSKDITTAQKEASQAAIIKKGW